MLVGEDACAKQSRAARASVGRVRTCDADERMEDSSLCCVRPGATGCIHYEIHLQEASASRHALTFAPLACLRSTRRTTLQQPDRQIVRRVEQNDGGLIVLRRSVVALGRPQPHFGFPALERGHGVSFSAPELAIGRELEKSLVKIV